MTFWKFLFTTVALAAGTAQGATPFYAQATASETNVFLGQVFTVDVVVKAPTLPAAPVLNQIAHFNITTLAVGNATSGTNTFLFRYAFRATQVGELTIPALAFLSPAETLRTHPLIIHARRPEPTDRMRLDTQLSATEVYLGEPVVLTTTWDSTYPFSALKAVDFTFPVLNDLRFQILDPYEPEQEKNAQTTGLPVQGTRVLASRKSYKIGEAQHQSLSFRKIILPKKVGALVIPSSTLLCAAKPKPNPNSKQAHRTAFQYPAYFDNTFFDQNLSGGNHVRIFTESSRLKLDVKPLPPEGRPALFNGMVGEYSIAVTAEPTEVRVGEPVTLTITITAADFMENIFFPPLRYQPGLIHRFEVPADRSLPQRSAKAKTYTQTIRPLVTTLTEIPPLQLAYFSPVSNRYITVQSAPIPLQVSPAEAVATYGMGTAPHRTRLRTLKEGIRHNYEDPDMLENQHLPWFGGAHPAWVLAILLLPPLLVGGFALAALFGAKKHPIHRTAKAARAYTIYRKNAAHIIRSPLTKREIYGDLDPVLRAYLGDRLHLNPGALSFRDVETYLIEAGATPKTLNALEDLFALCEAYRFTNHFDEPVDAKKVVHHADQIVKKIEGALR